MMAVPTPSPVVVLLFKCCLHRHVLSDFLLQFTESLSNRRFTQQTHNSTLWKAVSAALLASPDSTICWSFPLFLPLLFQQNTPMWNRLRFPKQFPLQDWSTPKGRRAFSLNQRTSSRGCLTPDLGGEWGSWFKLVGSFISHEQFSHSFLEMSRLLYGCGHWMYWWIQNRVGIPMMSLRSPNTVTLVWFRPRMIDSRLWKKRRNPLKDKTNPNSRHRFRGNFQS